MKNTSRDPYLEKVAELASALNKLYNEDKSRAFILIATSEDSTKAIATMTGEPRLLVETLLDFSIIQGKPKSIFDVVFELRKKMNFDSVLETLSNILNKNQLKEIN